MSISHHIYQQWTNVISESDATVNLSQLAKLIDTRVATVWSYHHGKAKWPADVWLLTMILTGCAKIEGGTLTLSIPVDILDPNYPIGFSSNVLRPKKKTAKE